MALIIGPVITSIDSELASATYVVGNHDAELWWNAGLQETLWNAGLVDEIAMSNTARIDSLEDQLVHGEHGNQFDPTNRYTDYSGPARHADRRTCRRRDRPTPRVRCETCWRPGSTKSTSSIGPGPLGSSTFSTTGRVSLGGVDSSLPLEPTATKPRPRRRIGTWATP